MVPSSSPAGGAFAAMAIAAGDAALKTSTAAARDAVARSGMSGRRPVAGVRRSSWQIGQSSRNGSRLWSAPIVRAVVRWVERAAIGISY